MRAYLLPLLLLTACGARTGLRGEPGTTILLPNVCNAFETTQLLALPSFEPNTTTGYMPMSGLTVYQGTLYFATPVYIEIDTPVPGPGIASLPVGGVGSMTLVVPTSTTAPVSPFVRGGETLTYLDRDLFQVPLAGGTPTKLAAAPSGSDGFLSIAAASDGFLVTMEHLGGVDHVVPSGDLATLASDPVTQFTSKLVRDGDVIFGASETGLYRVDAGVVTVLSTESSFDLAVDATDIYFTIRHKETSQRLIGARIPKGGGEVTYFVSPDPVDFGGEYVGDNGVALDASYAYFGDQGAVRAVSKSTGAVTTVGVGTAIITTTAIAVDEKCVYWSNDDNTIWAAPLPR